MRDRILEHRWLIPVALFGLALAAGLVRIGSKSIWYDEAVSISYASSPFDQMWGQVVGRDSNGGLYYLLLWGWVHLLGQGEAIVRLPSAIAAAGAPPILFLLGRRLFSAWVGLAAGILLICQGIFVAYAQEARSYALAMLLATLGSYLVVRARQGGTVRLWLIYAVAIAAGVYAHLFVALVALAHALWLLLERVSFRVVVPVFALVTVLSGPMLAFAVLNPGPDWMHGLQLDALGWTFLSFVSGSWVTLAVFGALVIGAAALAIIRRESNLAFVLLWLATPIVVMVAASALRPFLVTRYLIVALPALALTLAAAAAVLGRWPSRVSLAAVFVLSMIGFVGWYAGQPKPNWRAATQYVARYAKASDSVVFYPAQVELPFDYYVGRLGLAAPVGADPATADSVWLVMNYQYTGQTPPGLQALRDFLEVSHHPHGKVVQFDGVGVWLFVPQAPAAPAASPAP